MLNLSIGITGGGLGFELQALAPATARKPLRTKITDIGEFTFCVRARTDLR